MAIGFVRAAATLVATGIRRRRIETLLLVTVAALASGLLFMAGAVWSPSSAPFRMVHTQAGAPHVWFHMDSPSSTQLREFQDAVSDFPEVQAVSVLGHAALLRLESHSAMQVQAFEVSAATGSVAARLVDGRWPVSGEKEVVLDHEAARTLEVGTGDLVVLSGLTGSPKALVTGLAVSLLSCPYPVCRPAPVWATRELFELAGGGGSFVGVWLADTGAAAQVLTRARAALASSGLIGRGGSWEEALNYYEAVRGAVSAFLGSLSAVVLASVAVLLGGTVAAWVHGERREAMILRAIGFTPKQVRAVYVLWAGAATFAGSVLGWICARLAWRQLPFHVFVTLGIPSDIDGIGPTAVAFGVLPFALLVAWLAARSKKDAGGGRLSAAMGRLLRRSTWLHGALALVDAFARPRRALFSWLLVAGGTLTVTAALIAAATLRNFADDPPSWGVLHRAAVSVSELGGWDVPSLRIRTRTDEMGSLPPGTVIEQREQAVVTATGQRFALRAIGGDWDTLHWRMRRGEPLGGFNEIVLGTGLANRLGVRPGDSLDVEVQGRFMRLKVVGELFTVEHEGAVGLVTLDTLSQLGLPMQISQLLYTGEDPAAWAGELANMAGRPVAVDLPPQTPPPFVRDLELIALGLAMALAGAGIIGVGTASLLSAAERTADAALLTAMGLTPKGVLTIGPLSAAMLGGLGAVVGVPLGIVTAAVLFDWVGLWVGFGPVPTVWPGGQVVAVACAVPVLCAIVALPGVVRVRRHLAQHLRRIY